MLSKAFSTPDPVTLQIKLAAGEVRVTTDDVDESQVVLEGEQRLLDATRLELVGDRLVVEQRGEWWTRLLGWNGEALTVEARVPNGSSVEVAAASAETRLDGDFGRVSVKSASGDLVVHGGCASDLDATTASGDVAVDRVGGVLTVRTVSGDVRAESVQDGLSVTSVSGDVRVGSIRQGEAKAQSVSGDIELGIARGTHVDLSAASASGDLSSEIPLSPTPDRDAERGDEPTVVVRGNTVSGDFRIVRAAVEPSPA